MELGIVTTVMLIDIMIFWRLVSMVYKKQWDVFSSKVVFSIITGLLGVIAVSFISDLAIGKDKAMVLIFGTVFTLIMIGLNLAMFYLVRKMKYVEATIPLSAYQELKKHGGELKEDSMVCLIPRKDIFDIDKFLEKSKYAKQKEERLERLKDKEEQLKNQDDNNIIEIEKKNNPISKN